LLRRSATRTRAWPITRAACHFFAWVEQHEIGELADNEPIHVAAYIEVLQTTAAKPTVKLHLAAIRMLFDWLVVGQVIAAKRLKRGLAFSVEGQAEIRTMLERLAANVQGAAAVFMTDDARAARRLLGEKEVFRDLEARATEAHFARIRAGRVESVETSALHLDVLRDLKRINAHIAGAAYRCLKSSASCGRAVCGVTPKLMTSGRAWPRRVIGSSW
jgi:hypothetical protein